jgi:transposase InsO family protein
MAKILNITRSRYYAWLKRTPSNREIRDSELLERIKEIHEKSRKRYGSPKIHKELEKMGERCSRKRVFRIMRENGIYVHHRRKFKATTDSGHIHPVAPNILNRKINVEKPDKIWVSDITYVQTLEGWLYLCIILDLFSRRIVGWSMKSRLSSELATSALLMAISHRDPHEGLIFHSDRGVQYASAIFRKMLYENKMIQSMSRKGDCWDNACAENFFSLLKTEEVYMHRYRTREQARISIFDYIEVFYNRQRSHSFLDYLSPDEYEMNWIEQKIA